MTDFFKEEVDPKTRDFFHQEVEPDREGWPESQAKQQAAMVAAMRGENVGEDFLSVKTNLTEVGRDEQVESYRDLALTATQEINEEVAQEIAVAPGAATDKIEDLRELAVTERPQLRDAFVDHQNLSATTINPTEERAHLQVMDTAEATKAAVTEVEKLKLAEFRKLNPTPGVFFADFAGTALPGFGIKLKSIIDNILPEQGHFMHNLLPGEAMVAYREIMSKATPEEKVELAKAIIKASSEEAGILWQNDFEHYTFIQTLLDDLNPSDADRDWERVLTNVFGILDLIPFAAEAVRDGLSVFKHARRRSVIGTTSETAPRDALTVMKNALDDPTGGVADAIGTDKETIITGSMMPEPATSDSVVRIGPDINAVMAEPKLPPKGHRGHKINYFPSERDAAVEKTTSVLETVNNVEHLSKTIIKDIEGGFSAQVVVGATDSYGWSTLDELFDELTGFLEVQEGANINVLARNAETGTYEPIVGAEPLTLLPGEYLAQIDLNHYYNPNDVLAEGYEAAVIGHTGPGAKYLNKSSVFTKQIVDAGNIAADHVSFLKADLIRTMEPFYNLNAKGQSSVMSVIDEGDRWIDPVTGKKSGKWFDDDELSLRFNGDLSLKRGYQSIQAHQDRIWHMQNYRLRNQLIAGDYKHVTFGEGQFDEIARAEKLENIETGDLSVYDPVADSMVPMTPSTISELYEEGGYLARLKTDMSHYDEVTDLVIVQPGSGVRLLSLPPNILNKRGGYVTQVYEVTHIVKMKMTGIKRNGKLIQPTPGVTFNGKLLQPGERLVAIKMESNPAAAERSARQLTRDSEAEVEEAQALGRTEDKGVEYGVVRAKELNDIEYANQTSHEFYRGNGQLFFSKRGEEILSGTGERTLKSIADSIELARMNAARHVAMDDLIDSMTTRWEKKYGDIFGGMNGKMPLKGGLPKNDDPKIDKLRADATAIRDHINMLGGMDDTAIRRGFTKLNVWAGEKLGGMNEGRLAGMNEKLSELILKHRDKNLMDLTKALAFVKFIVMAPPRQILLQAQQSSVYLGIDHGFKYFTSGAGVRDFMGMLAGLSTIDSPRMWRVVAPQTAKAMGITTAEFKSFVTEFRKSGLPNAIDSHAFVQIMAFDKRSKISDSMIGAAGRHARRGAEGALLLARKVGFDAGEFTNILSAWLAVRNRAIKNHPDKVWTSPDMLDTINADARNVSFNMNAAGVLQHQKGALGTLFQFMSHTTKASQVLIPDTRITNKMGLGQMGDKAFSNAERKRIVLLQLGLYGTAGLGLNGVINSVRDKVGVVLPEGVNAKIDEGVVGSMFSWLYHYADDADENTSLAYSENFAPFSGTPQATPMHKMVGFVADLLMGHTPDYRMITPAGVAAVHQIAQTYEAVDFILRGVELPEDSPSKYLVAAEKALSIAPSYDKFLQARIAKATGQFISKSGNPQVFATGGEILAKATFGIRSKREVEIGDLYRELHGTSAVLEEGLNRRIDGLARKYKTLVMDVFRQLGRGGDMLPYEAYEALEPHITAMKLGLSETEFFYFQQRLQHHIFSDLDENNETRLGKELGRALGQRGPTLGGTLSTHVRNMQDFNGKQELIEQLDYIQANPLEPTNNQ